MRLLAIAREAFITFFDELANIVQFQPLAEGYGGQIRLQALLRGPGGFELCRRHSETAEANLQVCKSKQECMKM